jgi:hypothetical protein
MDTGEQWFTLDHHGGPDLGVQGVASSNLQPDRAKCLVRQQIHLSKYLYFMIVFAVDHLL